MGGDRLLDSLPDGDVVRCTQGMTFALPFTAGKGFLFSIRG